MSNLSNTHIADEQDINDLFAAAYSGDTEAYNRIADTVDEDEPEVTDDSDTDAGVATPDEVDPNGEVEDGSDDVPDNDDADADGSEEEESAATDPTASLREELHRYKSDAGRVPYLNRRVQELERQLQDAKLASPATKPGDAAGLPDELKRKIDRMREVDPDTADVMEATYQAAAAEAQKAMAAQQAMLAAQREREDQEHLQRETQRLLTAFPEAQEVFRSEKWKTWKSRLPDNFRRLAESSHADEVAEALRNFKVDAERYLGGYDWGVKQPATTAATTTAAAPSSVAAKASEARQRRLATSPSVRNGGARADTSAFDAEAAFAAAYKNNLPTRV